MQFNPRCPRPCRRRRSRAPPPRAGSSAVALASPARREVPTLRRSRARVRKVLARHGLDAHHRDDRQEHLRVAGAAQQAIRPRTSAASTRFPTKSSQPSPTAASTTLWLIGVWERSRASKTIKLLCGNQDAVASAYSLFDYRIADDLGGESAYINLRDRCLSPRHPPGQRHGAQPHGHRFALGRRASGVVHLPLGIALSGLQLRRPRPLRRWPRRNQDRRPLLRRRPMPPSSSAAATSATGETRYIYHGNDGTSFPWNDTAQLDYLNPAVREQVIQTILHVARLFPVIRFDAAMTLAKRHFHRLWFPGPGLERRHSFARRVLHEPGGIRPRSCRTNSGAKSSTASPPKSPEPCCLPRPSGSWKATSSAPWACIASTTAPSWSCCATRTTPNTARSSRTPSNSIPTS